MPAIIVASFLAFLAAFDEAQGTLIVGSPQIVTMPTLMYTLVDQLPRAGRRDLLDPAVGAVGGPAVDRAPLSAGRLPGRGLQGSLAAMARLELDHLVKRYGRGGEPAVQDLSLEVDDGEFVCLLGPSGCGKTTTLRMIGGFSEARRRRRAHRRHVSILNQPPERRPTAMVFQRYALWPHMTVWNNIAFGLQVRRRPRDEIARRVEAALDLVGLPAHGRGATPGSCRAASSSALRWPAR